MESMTQRLLAFLLVLLALYQTFHDLGEEMLWMLNYQDAVHLQNQA